MAGGKRLPQEIVAQIVAKTDGVPLFVEELTKAILESNLVEEVGERYALAGPLSVLAIPNSLRDSLMARLDRLAPVKEVAQIGACIGREFSDELMALLSPLPRAELDKALGQLTASELVFKRGAGKDTVYVFKHALVQDAAYDLLLKSKRAELHGKIALALEEHFPAIKDNEPELLAHHYTEAGLTDPAIAYWYKAGELALQRMALSEAIAHLGKGLALVPILPLSADRDGKELDLRILLGTAYLGYKGWAAAEVTTILQPALALAKSLVRHEALLVIYWGLFWNVLTQAAWPTHCHGRNRCLRQGRPAGIRIY